MDVRVLGRHSDPVGRVDPRLVQPELLIRLEYLPILLGIFVAAAAGFLIYDALSPAGLPRMRERRRRVRAERNQMGQGLIGIGMLAMAAALFGRDVWAYTTLSAITGAIFLVAGAVMNRTYLKEALFHRGASRRRDEFDEPDDEPIEPPEKPKSYRIR